MDYTQKCKELRRDIVKMLNIAKSGHPGGSLSELEILIALYYEVMNIDPKNPDKEDRERELDNKGNEMPLQITNYSDLDSKKYLVTALDASRAIFKIPQSTSGYNGYVCSCLSAVYKSISLLRNDNSITDKKEAIELGERIFENTIYRLSRQTRTNFYHVERNGDDDRISILGLMKNMIDDFRYVDPRDSLDCLVEHKIISRGQANDKKVEWEDRDRLDLSRDSQ